MARDKEREARDHRHEGDEARPEPGEAVRLLHGGGQTTSSRPATEKTDPGHAGRSNHREPGRPGREPSRRGRVPRGEGEGRGLPGERRRIRLREWVQAPMRKQMGKGFVTSSAGSRLRRRRRPPARPGNRCGPAAGDTFRARSQPWRGPDHVDSTPDRAPRRRRRVAFGLGGTASDRVAPSSHRVAPALAQARPPSAPGPGRPGACRQDLPARRPSPARRCGWRRRSGPKPRTPRPSPWRSGGARRTGPGATGRAPRRPGGAAAATRPTGATGRPWPRPRVPPRPTITTPARSSRPRPCRGLPRLPARARAARRGRRRWRSSARCSPSRRAGPGPRRLQGQPRPRRRSRDQKTFEALGRRTASAS